MTRAAVLERVKRNWLLAFVVILVGLFLRRPDSIVHAQFYAEDGIIFFAENLAWGPVNSFFVTYAGYLHVVPRLIAAFAGLFPIYSIPAVYGALAILIEALCCSLFAWPWYRYILRSDLLRSLCCVLFALVPYSETIGVVANVQWYLSLAGLLLIARRPLSYHSRSAVVRDAILMLLIALSAPQTILFVPIAIARLLRDTPRARSVPLALILGSLVQIATIAANNHATPEGAITIGSLSSALVGSFVSRGEVSLILGYHVAESVMFSRYTIAAGAIVTTAWLAALAIRLKGNARPGSRGVLAASLLLVLASIALVLVVRGAGPLLAMDCVRCDSRYFVLGCAIVIYWVALGIQTFSPIKESLSLATILGAVFVFGLYVNFKAMPMPDRDWVTGARHIETWRASFREGKPTSELRVLITPAPLYLWLPAENVRH